LTVECRGRGAETLEFGVTIDLGGVVANRSLFALAEFLIEIDRPNPVSTSERTALVPSGQSEEPVDREPSDSVALASSALATANRAA
jgi:hypothetical protein